MDKCNLCGKKIETSLLTNEHVPPKSCGNFGKVEIIDIFPELQEMEGDVKRNKKISQNGIKFKRICKKCNNEVMGGEIDKSFKDFYDKCVYSIKNKDEPFSIVINKINLREIVKCVFGKMLAMDSFYNNDTSCREMRNYIFYDNVPNGLHLYLRYYPYDVCYFSRNYGIKVTNSNAYLPKDGLISIFYYFPFGFVLSEQLESFDMPDLIQIMQKDCSKIVFESKTAYNLITNNLLPQDWLLNPRDGSYVILVSPKAEHSIVKKGNYNHE